VNPVDAAVLALLAVAGGAAFVALQFVSAPYGRHARGGWGPTMPQWLGWMVMESPAVWMVAGVALCGPDGLSPGSLSLLALWQFHYVHRTFVYPLRQRAPHRPMPAIVAGLAFVFNLLNGLANGRQLGWRGGYDADWWSDPRFLVGVALFLLGEALNHHADHTLLSLRKPGEEGYRIPYGGAFRWVSCPNYLGELVAWAGWAVATWSPAGVMFFLFTAANLVPRAAQNHRWYRETFPDYPRERRALIPWMW
jgi:protein-S-isoprenylcysteine O-methyltransferase Ste14